MTDLEYVITTFWFYLQDIYEKGRTICTKTSMLISFKSHKPEHQIIGKFIQPALQFKMI